MNIGKRVFGLGVAAMGVARLLFHTVLAAQPTPHHTAGEEAIAYASIAAMILGGLALNLRRTEVFGAAVLIALYAIQVVGIAGPPAVAAPQTWVVWQNLAEATALMCGGVAALAQAPGLAAARAATIGRVGRWLFALCLVVFGISHFVYAKYTASLVPVWIPPSQMIWTYVTGAAQIVVALALVAGIRARLAALLLAAMYAGFGLFVWVPHLMSAPGLYSNWAEFLETLALVGVAWTVADGVSRKTQGPTAA